jgi:steroid 5-alpha reductase family enzyme
MHPFQLKEKTRKKFSGIFTFFILQNISHFVLHFAIVLILISKKAFFGEKSVYFGNPLY